MANYGIHVLIELKSVSNRMESQFITAGFSCNDDEWSECAGNMYTEMLQSAKNEAKKKKKTIVKICPPNIIKLGEG